jgi:hypothetical protein
MKFLAITLIVHGPDPVTGEQKSTHERFEEVIANAVLAEELGFDYASNFSSYFRRKTQLTPGMFRTQSRSSGANSQGA